MQKLSYFWRGYYCEEDQEENIVVIHLEFDAFNVLKEEGKSKIQATGKDQHGNITLNGTIENENQVKLVYKSPKRELLFHGQRAEDGVIIGLWGPTLEDMGKGNFCLQKIEITQGWNGYYVQSDVYSQMKFEKLIIQAVPNGKIEGHGVDQCGPFTIKGNFDTATNEVTFYKTYTETNGGITWTYWGTLHNQQVNGQWGFKKGQGQGTFKLSYYE